MIQRPKNNSRNGDTVVPRVKEFQDTEVIKQVADVCLLGQRWNFACRLPGKGATITGRYYVALLDKLKQQLVIKRRGNL
jgi:hypothetical protein